LELAHPVGRDVGGKRRNQRDAGKQGKVKSLAFGIRRNGFVGGEREGQHPGAICPKERKIFKSLE